MKFSVVLCVAAAVLLVCFAGSALAEAESAGGCDNALFVPPPYAGTVLFGNTQGSPGYDNKCSSSSHSDTGTHFYIITPDAGSVVNVTTCHADTNFDTFLAVYQGSNCNQLACVAWNDDYCGGSSLVTFNANGDEYWIMVTGYGDSVGEYELSVFEEVQQPNDGCQAAVTIHGPFYQPVTIYDSIDGLPQDNNIPCSVNSEYGGNWYIIYPSVGSNLTVTTCTSNTAVSLDTIVAIFEGDGCSSLECVASNDDHCTYLGLLSTVTIVARAPMYYVYVAGYGYGTGGYYLTIAEEEGHSSPPPSTAGASCSSAVPIRAAGTSAVYSTVNGQVYPQLCGLSTSSGTFWFSFTPLHSDTYVFSTCNSATTWDTQIALTTGSCDSLDCLAANDDHSCSYNGLSSSVSQYCHANQQYFVTVTGFSTSAGDFELVVSRD